MLKHTTYTGYRRLLLDNEDLFSSGIIEVGAIPLDLKIAFVAGIGLFLTFIGLNETGIVTLGGARCAGPHGQPERPRGGAGGPRFPADQRAHD